MTDPGLCGQCLFHRLVLSARGSRFWLCERSRFDPRYPRYPNLPVLSCPGYRGRAKNQGPGAK